jgi:primosomal protein N'
MTKPSYVRVIIDRAIHRELDYAVPEGLMERVGVGSRVRVPFRDKSALATVVAITEQSEAKGIRTIEAVVLERTIAGAREVDQRLLLLPNRNSNAQFIAASHPARGNRMEKAIVRPARAQDRQ